MCIFIITVPKTIIQLKKVKQPNIKKQKNKKKKKKEKEKDEEKKKVKKRSNKQ